MDFPCGWWVTLNILILLPTSFLVLNPRKTSDAFSTAACNSDSSVLSESILSNTFFLLTNWNCGAELWNPVTRRMSPTRYRQSPA
ncbi:hypothetical protein ACJIZ3_001280 [Penstemon smallii]|uniref:Secreted protein n=1 Tax=Penstemon smallii TaxID=265156 RepID=A0ABD3U697_9LAMI